MPDIGRRFSLQMAGGASARSSSIARTLELPAKRGTGSIRDVQHVVILRRLAPIWG